MLLSGSPTMNREGEFTVPASNRIPLTETPDTSAIFRAAVPCVGRRVAMPRPRIMVLGWVTLRAVARG
jgi:hypothetical protein